jgi:hypothetical protein
VNVVAASAGGTNCQTRRVAGSVNVVAASAGGTKCQTRRVAGSLWDGIRRNGSQPGMCLCRGLLIKRDVRLLESVSLCGADIITPLAGVQQ